MPYHERDCQPPDLRLPTRRKGTEKLTGGYRRKRRNYTHILNLSAVFK
jgi:hypothetical protein